MICWIHDRGPGVRGLLYYLFGPGERGEHVNPRLVGAWPMAAVGGAQELEPSRSVGGVSVSRLANLLEQPVAAGFKPPPRPVWHCSVHNAPGDPVFADQHYSRAVFAAFQAVEHRIQQATGLEESGVKLMMQTFGANPKIDLARHSGRNATDEREGFRFLFAGAMQAIRNPRGHGVDLPDTADEALEYFALASLFMRRLDRAGV